MLSLLLKLRNASGVKVLGDGSVELTGLAPSERAKTNAASI